MSGEKSERGKFSVQNWQSDPMNSPKAFGELKICATPLALKCRFGFFFVEQRKLGIQNHVEGFHK